MFALTHRAFSWPSAPNAEGHFTFGISCHGSHEPAWPNQADPDRGGVASLCAPMRPSRQLPATDVTMRAIGQRLGRSCSERELTAIATRGPDLLGRLRPARARALARGYLRFTVDRPVVVDVAVPVASVPFWIADQGFRATDLVLENPDTSWRVYRKAFPGGTDRPRRQRTRPHAARALRRFHQAAAASEPKLGPPHRDPRRPRSPQSWKPARAGPGVSAARDFHKPFKTIPRRAGRRDPAAALAQRTGTARSWPGAGSGRRASSRPSNPARSRSRSAPTRRRELVWTWTTSPARRRSTRLRIRPDGRAKLAVTSGSLDEFCDSMRIVLGESTASRSSQPAQRPGHPAPPGGRRSTRAGHRLPLFPGRRNPPGWGPWRTVKTAPDARPA